MKAIKFRTEIKLKPHDQQIDHTSHLLLIGSCFSDHIFHKLTRYKYLVNNSPTGTLYNPISIENTIRFLAEKKEFSEADLFHEKGLFHSFDFHSDFSGIDSNKVLKKINQSIEHNSKQLKSASHCFITFGSAFVFKHKESNEVVANCHQINSTKFDHYILDFETCQQSIEKSVKLIRSVNNTCQIIATVSPVRYLSEGFELNQLSKSTLITAIHSVIANQTNFIYFPAYECLIDDLRDYRYYNEDLIHPNKQAIDYIWSKFSDVFFSKKSLEIISEIEAVVAASEHRPRQPDTTEYQSFIEKTLARIDQIENELNVDFTKEKKRLISGVYS